MAPATDRPFREAVLVAHGSPSDPAPQEEAMATLASAVMDCAPDLRVRGATLAGEGSLERALAGLHGPMIFPFFMAEGYFTTDVLPQRIAAAASDAIILPAFGSDPALPALVAKATLQGASLHRLDPSHTTLLLAAHGSQVSPASKRSTLELARHVSSTTSFRHVVTGFIEEEPFLRDAARKLGPSLCLPLFTLRAGHVTDDIPQELASAGFEGILLQHIGAHPAVPSLIAAPLMRLSMRKVA